MKLTDSWRISAFRLALLYGVLFFVAVLALLWLIYWRTAVYLTHQTDLIIEAEAKAFVATGAERLPATLNTYHQRDVRGINLYGLFSRDRRWITGNVAQFPARLPVDGLVHELVWPSDLQVHRPAAARAMAVMLPWGEIMIVGRDITQLEEIRHIISSALRDAGVSVLILGLGIGWSLSLRPLRRVQAVRAATERVAAGDLHVRLPVTSRHDELDMLAAVVNSMLGEIERLLGEVKSVCDNIAHDLRTPMTRLRASLHRLRQQISPDDPRLEMVDKALADTDALLGRFRALLRISEIEDRQRRESFAEISLGEILPQLIDLYQPVAEDQSKRLQLQVDSHQTIEADGDLMFEAIANLIDNAIKFSPPGKEILVHFHDEHGVPVLDVIDRGPGIPNEQCQLIFKRFYRGEHTSSVEGSGLGLSIVAAIIRLHGFSLRILDAEPGTCMQLQLRANPFAREPR